VVALGHEQHCQLGGLVWWSDAVRVETGFRPAVSFIGGPSESGRSLRRDACAGCGTAVRRASVQMNLRLVVSLGAGIRRTGPNVVSESSLALEVTSAWRQRGSGAVREVHQAALPHG
jgi:hypothetical protein